MDGLETLEALLKLGRQSVVRLDLGREEGVTADERGLVKDEEEGGGGRLLLVCDVRVPLELGQPVASTVVFETIVLAITVDNMKLGVALYITGCGVTMDRTEVSVKALEWGKEAARMECYLAISIWRSNPRSLKSWSRKRRTLRSAAYRASSSSPSLES